MPSIIAHRGVPRERPENTLAGFELALRQGADGIELDVHATVDGVVVVHHDPVLAVRAREQGGHSALASMSWREVQRMAPSEAPIPRLDDVLDLVGGTAELFVEVKAAGIEELIATVIRPHLKWCAVHSFDHRIPVRLAALLPRLRTGLLSCSYPLAAGEMVRHASASHFWQSEGLIDEPLVRAVHDAGAQVIAWTVNDLQHASALAAMGVDGLCTDRPRAVHTALRGSSPAGS